MEKYHDLLLEVQRLWNVKVEVIPIINGALSALSPKFEGWLRRLNIKLHPSIRQKTVVLETAGLLRQTLNIHLKA